MIPRALPRLITDALTNGWAVGARHHGTSLFATHRTIADHLAALGYRKTGAES